MKKLILLLALMSTYSLSFAPNSSYEIQTILKTIYSFDIKLVNTKLNNPFNIERNSNNNWKGKDVTNTNRFERFHDVSWGIRAGIILIKNYNKWGYNTIQKIAHRYAPNNENNTVKWINDVAKLSGIAPNKVFDSESDTLIKVCKAIMVVESSYK